VTYRSSVSTLTPLTPRYDAFLFARVCNDASGTSLSVVSALARANVDPWDEASRLSAMPRAIAEKALVATLDLIPGRDWKPADAKSIAARLVRLLPRPGEGGPADVSPGVAKQKSYWWLWLGFAIGGRRHVPIQRQARHKSRRRRCRISQPHGSIALTRGLPNSRGLMLRSPPTRQRRRASRSMGVV
jgi:hypothetical protein